jgi:hypothetical protein
VAGRLSRSSSRRAAGARTAPLRPPTPHPSGALAPGLAPELVPRHVALVMDGNGRWAKDRGLPRTAGHEAGEASLLDCVHGAIELGVGWISAYAFSTENWKRSPDEVRFLMGFNRDVIRRRRDEMNELGVRVRWAGRRPKLWKSVIDELEEAERLTAANTTLTLTMCVNYGGRAEIAGAAHQQLPALAGGVRRAGVRAHALAGLRPPAPVVGLRAVRVARPALRRRGAPRAAARHAARLSPHDGSPDARARVVRRLGRGSRSSGGRRCRRRHRTSADRCSRCVAHSSRGHGTEERRRARPSGRGAPYARGCDPGPGRYHRDRSSAPVRPYGG